MMEPVKICDPKASLSVVKLAPMQELILSLSSDALVDFDFVGLLDVDEKVVENKHVYRFRQILPGLPTWSKFSCVFLGNVFILRSNSRSVLSLMLKSETSHVVTVLNPVGAIIRLIPPQILEVVLTREVYNYAIQEGDADLMYAKLGSVVVDPLKDMHLKWLHFKHQNSMVPLLVRNTKFKETHFWFAPLIPKTIFPAGIYNSGSIIFGGKPAFGTMDISLKFRRRDTKRMKNVLVKSENSDGHQQSQFMQQTVVVHRRNVVIEELGVTDWADGCNTVEYVGSTGSKIVDVN